jgi:hypothetical protein
VQGDCEPSANLPGVEPDAQPNLRYRQCFILVDRSFLKWDGISAELTDVFWIDNLYIKLKPRSAPSQVAFITFYPRSANLRLWASGIYMEGDGMIPQVGYGLESWCIGIDSRNGPLMCSGVLPSGILGLDYCTVHWCGGGHGGILVKPGKYARFVRYITFTSASCSVEPPSSTRSAWYCQVHLD